MSFTPYRDTSIVVKLRQRRDQLAHRKSQAEIAKEMGYNNPNNVANFLTGRNPLPYSKFPEAMSAFEIPQEDRIDYLILACDGYHDNKMWEPILRCLKHLTKDQLRILHKDAA